MKRKIKPTKHVEVGAFVFDFYFKEGSTKGTFLKITCGEVLSMRIDGRTYTYGYLLEAAKQDKLEALHGYAAMLYFTTTRLTQDQEFVNDIVSAIESANARLEQEAKERAAAVTEEQELSEQIALKEIVSESKMSESEQEKNRELFKEAVESVIKED